MSVATGSTMTRAVAVACALVMLGSAGAAQKPAPAPTPGQPPAASPPLQLDAQTTMEFVPIAPGRFSMGSKGGAADEKPVHEVTISRGFDMGRTEVTEAQWTAVMGSNPWRYQSARAKPIDRTTFTSPGGTHPEAQLSWEDVQRFTATLNARRDGYTYRLPTEAEWEYAARAGTTGDYAGNLWMMGRYRENSGDGEDHAVGTKRPNGWGLYDMHGNVWEWVSDWYAAVYPSSSAVTDPTGPSSGKYRVFRGGSWATTFGECRSASRSYGGPGGRDAAVGFRLARVRS